MAISYSISDSKPRCYGLIDSPITTGGEVWGRDKNNMLL